MGKVANLHSFSLLCENGKWLIYRFVDYANALGPEIAEHVHNSDEAHLKSLHKGRSAKFCDF